MGCFTSKIEKQKPKMQSEPSIHSNPQRDSRDSLRAENLAHETLRGSRSTAPTEQDEQQKRLLSGKECASSAVYIEAMQPAYLSDSFNITSSSTSFSCSYSDIPGCLEKINSAFGTTYTALPSCLEKGKLGHLFSSRLVVLHSHREQDQLSTHVPFQLAFMGTSLVIPSQLADTRCATSGLPSLLAELNNIFGTEYTFDSHPGLESLLQHYIDNDRDFGEVYAHLRPEWATGTLSQDYFQTLEENDRQVRLSATDSSSNSIVQPNISPRRLWDLYSNRVVPSYIWIRDRWDKHGHPFSAVSHSWMSEDLRQLVATPINAYEWPVPIPTDITLEQLRIDLLNHGQMAPSHGARLGSN
jgi:hypothetical protein